MARLAFDVDLLRVHGYSETDGRVCYNASEWPWDSIAEHETLLVEIASPVDTSRVEAEAYNRRKWAIGNSLMIGRLMLYAEQNRRLGDILVSPANVWTEQYDEKTREQMSFCYGEDNHDIRACRCMLHFHEMSPSRWRPILDYYQSLSRAKKKGSSR